MNKLITLVSILFCLTATESFASGKINVKPIYSFTNKSFSFSAGLGIYEKILGPVYYNGWTGLGEPKKDDGQIWFVSKHALDFYVSNNLTLSPGFQFDYYTKDNDVTESVFLNTTIKLW